MAGFRTAFRNMENSHGCPRVVIILLNWNSRMDTLECLESVFRLNYPDYRVVLCDNDSSDGSLESVQEWAEGRVAVTPASDVFAQAFAHPRPRSTVRWTRLSREQAEGTGDLGTTPELVLIETGANLGFAGGNNVGIRYALKHLRPDYFWLLNTDTLVDPGALDALINRAVRDNSIGMVGSSIIYYWEPNKVQTLGGASLERWSTRMRLVDDGLPVDSIPKNGSEVESRMAYVIGASMLITRQFVEQVGLMCEDYFLYYEEIDWILRAKGQFKIGYAPDSKVFHKVGGASRRVASLASMRFMYRNRIKFVARFMPRSLIGTLSTMVLDMLRAALKGRFGISRVIGEALLDARRLFAEGKRKKEGVQS